MNMHRAGEYNFFFWTDIVQMCFFFIYDDFCLLKISNLLLYSSNNITKTAAIWPLKAASEENKKTIWAQMKHSLLHQRTKWESVKMRCLKNDFKASL